MSCLPCGDSKECDIKKSEAKISATDNHQQHKHDTEACTPFCTCSCCAVSIVCTPFSKAQINKAVSHSVKYPIYNVAFNAGAHSSIWQPPKIS